jgi:hypothetical protein
VEDADDACRDPAARDDREKEEQLHSLSERRQESSHNPNY